MPSSLLEASLNKAKIGSMLLDRVLRAINLSIAVLAVLVAGAVYWLAYRPLPETSGSITAPLSGAATITRDAYGVPHIKATSWEDAIFLEGYAMAQDRLWQMDGMRRRAAGELAEVIGQAALAGDSESRRLRLGRIAEEQESRLEPKERAVLAAFARGVNYFLSTHQGKLPVEFSILRYDPRPWSVRSSVLAGLEMYRTLTMNWAAERNRMELFARGDRTKLEYLMPADADAGVAPGSNAWVVSGAHSATGKPILSNDPHLEFSLPSPWYLVHLEAPGLNVTGATIVGLPGVVVGHNERIAWGVTNLEFDVQDLYREQLDLNTGQYLYQGKVEQARPERDLIAVRDAAPLATLAWVTRHGAAFTEIDGKQYSLRWTAAEPGGFRFPFLDIDRARNWQEFVGALEHYAGPGQNFVYADVDGNIGYQAAGMLPVRRNCAGDLPSDGTNGECEWDGYIPFADLPRVFNPESGIIATANQNPFPSGFRYKVNGRFAPPYRVRQIRSRLNSQSKWKPEEMVGVQRDVYSAVHLRVAREVVAAWDRKKSGRPELAEAVDELRKWNGQMSADSPAALLAVRLYDHLRKLIADTAADSLSDTQRAQVPPQAVERIVRQRPAGWFPDWDAVMVRALVGAFDEAAKTQGSKAARWKLGPAQALRMANPVMGRIPVLGGYFNLGPVPMSGAPWTVLQYNGRIGPSMRMTVDLSALDKSTIGLTAGESGQPLSSHYKDQWTAYVNGASLPMQYQKVEAKDVLNVTPQN
ncbi:MAG: penicillin acylase family protein [Bryobacteraceae bacterium]